MSEIHRRTALSALGLAGIAAAAKAGPLNPPGAIAPTGKVIGEVEPRIAVNATNTPGTLQTLFRISQPGSYYLTGNILQTVANRFGIEIAANDVTLDLCGFTVQGGPGTGDGIAAGGTLTGITIKNGNVRGWGASGIALFNGVTGAVVSNVLVTGCGGSGVFIDQGGVILQCVAVGCGAGFSLNQGGTLVACAARDGVDGFLLRSGTSAFDCAAQNNSRAGFTLTDSSRAIQCHSYANVTGFILGVSCAVRACAVLNSSVEGFRFNGRNGVAEDCTAASCGTAFRLVAASVNCRLTGNHAQDNVTSGFVVESVRNLLIRNTSSGSTPWSIVANNYAQVIQPSASAALSGASGGTALAPSGYDPNANFTLV